MRIARQQDVGRLNPVMHDTGPMESGQRFCNFSRDGLQLFPGDTSLRGVTESLTDWLAFNVLADHKRFDAWRFIPVQQSTNAVVLHVQCGLQSPLQNVKSTDFPAQFDRKKAND